MLHSLLDSIMKCDGWLSDMVINQDDMQNCEKLNVESSNYTADAHHSLYDRGPMSNRKHIQYGLD